MTVDGSASPGRIEIRSSVGRRRRWNAEEKGGIVAASFAPGAVVSEVACRHELADRQESDMASLDASNKSARKNIDVGLDAHKLAREQRDTYDNPFG
jgi:hypothetical protein